MAVDLESVVEFFPALADSDVVRHGFIGRIPGLDVATDRASALARLDTVHRALKAQLCLGARSFATAEQVHGNKIASIAAPLEGDRCFEGVDGLITNQPGVTLGIYVADCAAVYLVDPVRRALGLVHSGKKGTELGIVSYALAQMQEHFGSNPAEMLVQLGPCIRPPHYEVDFAAEIVRQAHRAGVERVQDAGACTACDLQRYYSYRAEKARTGRMLALLGLTH